MKITIYDRDGDLLEIEPADNKILSLTISSQHTPSNGQTVCLTPLQVEHLRRALDFLVPLAPPSTSAVVKV